jgi:hypothetical protein
MTLLSAWNHYVGVLLAELPALAARVATGARERVHAALDKSYGVQRQHLLAVLQVLRAESSSFGDALAAALRQQVHAGLHEPADPPASDAPAERQPLSLSLMDDQQVERDIELARVIQLIESTAEWELRDLQAFYATLRRARSIRPEQNPLRPEMCASALLSTLQEAGLSHEARVLALHASAQPLADALRELYAQHCSLLRRSGVQAQNYRVQRAAPGADRDGALRGLAERLTAHAGRRNADRDSAPAGAPAPSGEPPRDAALPMQLIPKLLEQIADQAEMNATMRGLLARLRIPVARAAEAEAGVLRSLDHPVWRLVDRIASLSSVNDGRGDGGLLALAELLEPIVARLEQADRPGTGVFQEALNQVGEATIRLNSRRLPPVAELDIDLTKQPASKPRPGSDQGPRSAREIDAQLRRWVAAQLRSSSALPPLRQFLLGPWVAVMAHAIVQDGPQAAQTLRWQSAVGEFIVQAEAAGRSGERLPAASALLELAAQGMQSAAIPGHQLESNLVELRAVLLNEPAPRSAPRRTPGDDDHPSTVPMDMVITDADTPAKQDREAWLAQLVPGDLCRLFIQSRWMNAQLTWRSRNGQFCVFASRHGGRLHTLTRRQLERLRASGLATTVERGQQVRDAVDTLARDIDEEDA